MNSKQQLREQIEEILPKESAHYYTDKLLALFEQREAALLKEVGEKVIGRDIYTGSAALEVMRTQQTINDLKAEQRIALAKLQEGEK